MSIALLLVFLPIFSLVVYTHLEDLHERRESRIKSLQTVDETVAASLDGFARDLETFATSASITLSTAAAAGIHLDQTTFGGYFSDLAASYNVRSVFITDLQGRVLAGTSGNVGFDVSTRPYIQKLQAGAETAWSGGLAGQESGQTTLAYGRVVRVKGAPVAYLVVAFYPPQLSDRLPPELPSDANVTLIDNGGVVLLNTASPDDHRPTVDVSQSELFKQVAGGSTVLVRGKRTPVDSDKRYGAFVPIQLTGWVVGLTRPASHIDGPIQAKFERDLLVISAAFVLAFGVMIIIANNLSRPLTSLADSAAALARGDPFPAQKPAYDRDVLLLQEAMAEMSLAIADRETKLTTETRAAERLANQLARLHTSRNALASLHPPEDICSVVVTQAIDALEAASGAVFLPNTSDEMFDLAAATGFDDEVLARLTNTTISEPSAMRDALGTGKGLFFNSGEDLKRAYPGRAGVVSAAGIEAAAFLPLLAQGRVLGVLLIAFKAQREFAPDDIALMFAFASQAAQALHRAQLYEAEKEVRSRLETVIGGLPGVVWESWLDPKDAAANFVSPYIETLMGFTPEEWLSDSEFWLAKVHPEDRQAAADRAAGILATGSGINEFRWVAKDDHVLWARVIATVIQDEAGRPVGLRGITLDISEQRRAQLGVELLARTGLILNESLDYETTLQNLTDVIVPGLADWCSVHVVENGQVEQVALSHRDPQKVRWAHELQAKFPPDPDSNTGYAAVIRSGRSELVPEIPAAMLEAAMVDDERRQILDELALKGYICVPLRTLTEVIGALSLVSSDSKRIYDKDDLLVVEEIGRRAGLAIEKARLYRDSQLARQELTRSNEAKDEFLGIVSHELRTPIATIYGGARLLNDESRRLPDVARVELMKNIEQEADRLARLVENLLLLARMEMGRQQASRHISLDAVIDSQKADFARSQRGRELRVYNDSPDAEVFFDETSLGQVLSNLFSNAAKYSPAGEPIDLFVERSGEGIDLRVCDRGPGVKPEELSLIFDSFYRSPKTSGEAAGKGIGLAVCRRLLASVGGSIWAQPRPGGGLEVCFRLLTTASPEEDLSIESNVSATLQDERAPTI